jgi:hypothetical protein
MPRVTIRVGGPEPIGATISKATRSGCSAPTPSSTSASSSSPGSPPRSELWLMPARKLPRWPRSTTPTPTPGTSASEPAATPDPTTRRPPGTPPTRRPPHVRGGGPGEGAPSPGVLAIRIARGAVVPAGRVARPSRANVRRPPQRSPRRVSPFALDGLPGTTPCRPRSVAVRDAPSARAASLASSAALPVLARLPPWPRRLTPTSFPTSTPTSFPTRPGCVPPRRPEARSPLVMPPRGASRPRFLRPTSPPRGSGAARPSGRASRD